MKLSEYRKNIEEIDKKIMELIKNRLKVSVDIGNYKKENKLNIIDNKRESMMFNSYKEIYNDDNTWKYYKEILQTIIETSRVIQNE